MLAAGVGAVTLALVAGACGSTGGSGGSGSSGAPVKGGTATMAEFPGSPPNYAFPFMNSTFATRAEF